MTLVPIFFLTVAALGGRFSWRTAAKAGFATAALERLPASLEASPAPFRMRR